MKINTRTRILMTAAAIMSRSYRGYGHAGIRFGRRRRPRRH